MTSDPAPPAPRDGAPRNGLTYRDAGVDIAAGDALVEAIRPLAESTRRRGATGGLGGFGATFDLRAAGFTDPILVSTTDGVGTKLKIAFATGQARHRGPIDLVAITASTISWSVAARPSLFSSWTTLRTGRLSAGRNGRRRRGRASPTAAGTGRLRIDRRR